MNVSYSASDFIDKITYNDNKYVSYYKKRVREPNEAVQDLREKVENFRKDVRELKNFDPDGMTKEKLGKYLEKFVDSYNDIKEASEEITDKKLLKTLSELEEYITQNEKGLKKIGIKKSKGTMVFDSELLDDAKTKEIKRLFDGNDSVFKTMYRMLRKIDQKAEEAEYEMVVRTFNSVTTYSEAEKDQAIASAYLCEEVGYLENNNEKVQSYDPSTGVSIDDVKTGLDGFLWGYNEIVGNGSESIKTYVSYMIEKTKENAANFTKLGITVKDDGMLEYYSDAKVDSTFKEGYAALFGENATYANLMKIYTNNILNTTLKAESLGITINAYV